MPRKLFILFVLILVLVAACQPTTSAEDLAITYVAATEVFTTAVAEAVSTGIAATIAAEPTDTPTNTPTKTTEPTAPMTLTPTPTGVPTDTATPTITNTPEPTVTTTPTAGQIKAGQLYAAIRDMKYYAEQLVSGLDVGSTGGSACSRELRDSIIINFEAIQGLPVFDDSLLSSRAIGANINYNHARKIILENPDTQKRYNRCVAWVDAGKPANFDFDGGNWMVALEAARQAVNTLEQALNN